MYNNSFSYLRNIVFSREEGTLFSVQDLVAGLNAFDPEASYDSVRRVLSDLSQKGCIQRICNGIYRKVNVESALANTAPSVDEVLALLARDNNWIIRPGTEMAREMLGLSFDPAHRNVYACSGLSYKYTLSTGGVFRLEKCSGKFMTADAVTEKAAIVTIALLDLGNHRISAEELAHLSKTLTKEEKFDLIRAIPYVPARLRPVFEIICGIYGIGGR